MQRRLVLKNLGLITGGILILPSCNFSEEMATIALNKLQITKNKEVLLTDIIDTMLPEDTILGGKSVGVHNFVWIIMDDCAKKEDQESFVNGLDLFQLKIKKTHNNSFSKLSPNEKESSISTILENKNEDKDLIDFLTTTKNIAIWGYKNSEYYMTEIMPYSLVPGTFSNCETINNTLKINTNA